MVGIIPLLIARFTYGIASFCQDGGKINHAAVIRVERPDDLVVFVKNHKFYIINRLARHRVNLFQPQPAQSLVFVRCKRADFLTVLLCDVKRNALQRLSSFHVRLDNQQGRRGRVFHLEYGLLARLHFDRFRLFVPMVAL